MQGDDNFSFFVSGLMLETPDGHQDEEETAASLDIKSVTDLTMKDVVSMNKTWRKKSRRF